MATTGAHARVMAVALLAAVLVFGHVSAAGQTQRVVWKFNDTGSFHDEGGKRWVEKDAAGTRLFDFKEVVRNDDFIELYDKTRDVTIRLYKDVAYIKTPTT